MIIKRYFYKMREQERIMSSDSDPVIRFVSRSFHTGPAYDLFSVYEAYIKYKNQG